MKRSTFSAAVLAAVLSVLGFAQTTQAPQFTISTIAGNGIPGFSGDGGPASNALLNTPFGVTVDAAGNLYIVDANNYRIRRVATNGTITTVAGTGAAGFSGDGGPATRALMRPTRVSVDRAGTLYIADGGNNRVRKVTPDGIITTVAGNGTQGYTGDGGPATSATLNGPVHAVPDAAGNIFIVDQLNNAIRKVDTRGIISTVAGSGVPGLSGDGGPATSAFLSFPVTVALNSAGDLFIADADNNRIRKVSNGTITTAAGGGNLSQDGIATAIRLFAPFGVATDDVGNLYIAEVQSSRIRVLLANGTIVAVAGTGTPGFGGDGGPALRAQLNDPRSLATFAGRVYVADYQNQRVRLLTPVPQAPTISTGGVVSASAFGAFTSISPGSWIEIFGGSLAANTRSWADADFKGVNAPTSLDGTTVTIGGKAAFVDFISPGQVNALVPSDTPTGAQQMTVTTALGTSAAYNITVNAVQPGLLAPPTFAVGGKQYAVALFPDGTYVLPVGAISGVASHPAKPGETIVLYGVGFGPVTPNIPAGQLVQQPNALASSLQMSIGGIPALASSYAGLAPSFTGLYQFNVTVPSVAPSNAALTFTLNGLSGTQTLYVAVGN